MDRITEKAFSNKDFGSIEYEPLSFKNSISSKDFKQVYKPNDDSYQMLYSLILGYRQGRFPQTEPEGRPLRILELGSGSGFVIGNFVNFIALEDPTRKVRGTAVDVNDKACAAARRYFEANQLADRIKVVHADGLEGVEASDIGRCFGLTGDIFILNPVAVTSRMCPLPRPNTQRP